MSIWSGLARHLGDNPPELIARIAAIAVGGLLVFKGLQHLHSGLANPPETIGHISGTASSGDIQMPSFNQSFSPPTVHAPGLVKGTLFAGGGSILIAGGLGVVGLRAAALRRMAGKQQ